MQIEKKEKFFHLSVKNMKLNRSLLYSYIQTSISLHENQTKKNKTDKQNIM